MDDGALRETHLHRFLSNGFRLRHRRDSNPQPPARQAGTLAVELLRQAADYLASSSVCQGHSTGPSFPSHNLHSAVRQAFRDTRDVLPLHTLRMCAARSEWKDSNLRSPGPKPGALPSFATLRWYLHRDSNPVSQAENLESYPWTMEAKNEQTRVGIEPPMSVTSPDQGIAHSFALREKGSNLQPPGPEPGVLPD